MTEPRRFKQNLEVESIDIHSMYALTDEEYRTYVDGDLVFVDHHDVLRVANTTCPLATTREQLDIFIDELQRLRETMRPRSEIG